MTHPSEIPQERKLALRRRPADHCDAEEAFLRFGYPFAYEEDVRPHVPRVWHDLLRSGAMIGNVLEDRGEMAAFAAVVFVSDRFVEEALMRPRPWVRSQLVRWVLEGRHPVLSVPEVRAANADGGLNLFLANDAFGDYSRSPEELIELDIAYEQTFTGVSGLNMKSQWWESYGTMRRRFGENCGLLLRSDFPEYAESLAHLPEDRRPSLGHFTREDAARFRGTHIAYMFTYKRPRFGFSLEQQAMLVRALRGETDGELAASLYVSLSAVKKRWAAVYEKVEAADPHLLPPPLFVGGGPDRRGVERRRYLLNYLRDHLEEFSPEQAMTF